MEFAVVVAIVPIVAAKRLKQIAAQNPLGVR